MTPVKKIETLYDTQAQGFSLIEVLVALLVLSIGLLGLAALQTTSLKYNTDSYFRTQATFFVYDIMDRMRANNTSATVANGGTYDVSSAAAATAIINSYATCSSSSCACDTSSCSATDLATYDLGKWYERMAAVLPDAGNSLATIDITATKQVTITISWKERDLNKSQSWVMQL